MTGPQEGMSLRDYFAGQAVPLILADDDGNGWSYAAAAELLGEEHYTPSKHYPAFVAKMAYQIADAMLREREVQR